MTGYSAPIGSFKCAIRQTKHADLFPEMQKRRVRRIAGRNLAHLRKKIGGVRETGEVPIAGVTFRNDRNGSSSAAAPGRLPVIVSVAPPKLSFGSPDAQLPKTFDLGYY